MKDISLEQMINVKGGLRPINWCAVSLGVAGSGGILPGLGFTLAGPIAAAAYASFSAYAIYCELTR